MRRLEEFIRQMCLAAKVIGDTALEGKFVEAIAKIKRDIIFAASLYLWNLCVQVHVQKKEKVKSEKIKNINATNIF